MPVKKLKNTLLYILLPFAFQSFVKAQNTGEKTPTILQGKITTENLEAIKGVTCKLSSSDSCLTNDAGIFIFNCAGCKTVNLTPSKKDEPLQGINTWDLVLMSRHILGIQALDSPGKLMAADVNKSGTITTFDIAELRKLLLGINRNFKDNTSWRFVPARHFSTPSASGILDNHTPDHIECSSFPAINQDFIGIKTGDVDNSAMATPTTERPLATISWPDLHPEPGEVITIPVTWADARPMEAIQFGLRFDTSKLKLLAPSQGDLESYGPANFNLSGAAKGTISTLWLPLSDLSEGLSSGRVLFYLSFKVSGVIAAKSLLLWLDDTLIDAAAWASDGKEYTLQHGAFPVKSTEETTPASVFQASVHSDAGSGETTLSVQAPKAEKARIALCGPFGERIFMREVQLAEGTQELTVPEMAAVPEGVYIWKLYTRAFKVQGHFIKE